MTALYAFCRCVDDIADEDQSPVEARRNELSQWREDIGRACAGKEPEIQVNRELTPYISKYQLPLELFEDLIRGVEMDLDINRIETREQLDLYCYRVASVVGLLSIRIFGDKDGQCVDYAVNLGKALQITNILRDVRTDAQNNRIYIPQDMLDQFGVTTDEILSFKYSDRFRKLAENLAEQANVFYCNAVEQLPSIRRKSLIASELMGAVYWNLLKQIKSHRFNVFGPHPVRLSSRQKFRLILRTWFRLKFGSKTPNYGDS